MTTDPFAGEELTDGDLQGEIELVGDLVVAASDCDGHLSQERIDEVLGVFDAATVDAAESSLSEAPVTPRVEAPACSQAEAPAHVRVEPLVEAPHGRPRRQPATTTG